MPIIPSGHETQLGYWKENLRRTFRDYEDRSTVIGILAIVLAAFGYGHLTDDPGVAKLTATIIVAYLLAQLLIVTPARMWIEARGKIANYQDRLAPRLSFAFDPSVPPYCARYVRSVSGGRDGELWIYRVGIRNESAATIKSVRVVVESAQYVVGGVVVEPSPRQPVLVEHALNVMGIDKKDGTFNLSPGDRPTAYVDVVQQDIVDGEPEASVSLCYATKFRTAMAAHDGSWMITLRAEGGNASRRATFEIVGASGQIKLKAHSV